MKLFEQTLINYFRDTLGLPEWKRKVQSYLSGEHAQRLYKKFREETKFENMKILDMGSGFGCLGNEIQKHEDVELYVGIDPSYEKIKIARRRVFSPDFHFVCSWGENLPFSNEYFDIVISHSTLEHVKNPEKYLKEFLRVLKSNGEGFLFCSNYRRPYEPHYQVFWLPIFNHRFFSSLGKLYLKLRGRDPTFLDSLNFITREDVYEILDKHNVEYKELGLRKTKNKFNAPEKIKNKHYRFVVKLFKNMSLEYFLYSIWRDLGSSIFLKIKK